MIMIMISYNVLQKRLISQKYKKCSPGKYALLLYVAVSIRWISIRFDAEQSTISAHKLNTLFTVAMKYSHSRGKINVLTLKTKTKIISFYSSWN